MVSQEFSGFSLFPLPMSDNVVSKFAGTVVNAELPIRNSKRNKRKRKTYAKESDSTTSQTNEEADKKTSQRRLSKPASTSVTRIDSERRTLPEEDGMSNQPITEVSTTRDIIQRTPNTSHTRRKMSEREQRWQPSQRIAK